MPRTSLPATYRTTAAPSKITLCRPEGHTQPPRADPSMMLLAMISAFDPLKDAAADFVNAFGPSGSDFAQWLFIVAIAVIVLTIWVVLTTLWERRQQRRAILQRLASMEANNLVQEKRLWPGWDGNGHVRHQHEVGK